MCTQREVAGLARRPRHLAAASVVALSLPLPACGGSPTAASAGWPEITALPINVAPVAGDYAGDVLIGPQATRPSQSKPFFEMGYMLQTPTGSKVIPNFEFYVRGSAVVVEA